MEKQEVEVEIEDETELSFENHSATALDYENHRSLSACASKCIEMSGFVASIQFSLENHSAAGFHFQINTLAHFQINTSTHE